jgi:hypothetical protein
MLAQKMKTIRWIKVKWPLPLIEVSKRLLANQYDEDRGRGFILTSSGKHRASGKFVEKITKPTIIVDPFGNETESQATIYYVSKFSFNSSSELMELESPPRSIRKLISELHSVIGLGMELSDIKVDPLVWLQELESLHSLVLVRHISSSEITVPKNGLAKISVSGKKDIRDEFARLIGKKSRVIDLVKFSGVFKQCNIIAETSKSGTIKYSGHVYDGFKEDIKECLERSILGKS